MTPDPGSASARALVDEWVRAGVTDAVIAPGSRSTPLTLALATDGRVRVHVMLDERSAAGFALGLGHATRRPAVVCCTSGTAGAHFHGAVLEAYHGRVPIIVCTADRPPELHDVGSGQTVSQHRLFGDAVRWFHDPGVPSVAADDDVGADPVPWRHLGARSVAVASGPPAGPVHLNLAFRDPLVPSALVPPLEGGRPGDGAATRAPSITSFRSIRRPREPEVDALVRAVRAAPRGVLVAGWGAEVSATSAAAFLDATGWPLLADPLSNLRLDALGDAVISTYDALLRIPAVAETVRADLTVRVGAPLTSPAARAYVDAAPLGWLVDPHDAWLDPGRSASVRVTCDGDELLARVAEVLGDDGNRSNWRDRWSKLDDMARSAIDDHCDADDRLFEGRIARDVVAALPAGSALVVASSMPVRDVESFAAPRDGLQVLANRGANGIDGFVSTVLGVATGWSGTTVGLLGDLCFLHDVNGLLGARGREVDATFVVVDNDGGGIFSFLAQARSDAVSAEHFELLFATPHGIDLAALAAVHRIPCDEVITASAVGPAVAAAVATGGVRIVLVRTERSDNPSRHEAVWAAVSSAVLGLLVPDS